MRPSWQVDLKWLAGLACLACIALALSPTAGSVAGDFLRLFILGLVLILAATLGHLGWLAWERYQRSRRIDTA